MSQNKLFIYKSLYFKLINPMKKTSLENMMKYLKEQNKTLNWLTI